MEHGDQAEPMVRRYLAIRYEATRDRVYLLGKSGGYTEDFVGAMSVRGVQGEQEPEAVPPHIVAQFVRRSRDIEAVLKAEELARKKTRSLLERQRQAAIELRKRGKPVDHHLEVIERQVNAMERDARAA